MKISTATSVFVNYSIDDAIRCAAEAGYDGVDIWGGRPHAYRHDYSSTALRRIRDLVVQFQLSVPSFMPAFYRYPHSLVSPNEKVRQDSLLYMYECADNAVELGAEYLLIVPGRSLSNQGVEDGWQRLADSVASVCHYAAQYDELKLAIEPANSSVSDLVVTASDAMELIETIDDKKLGVALDTGHIHLSDETPEQAVKICGERLFQVHVNDNNGKVQQNLILGEGTFAFAEFVNVLDANGYSGYLTAELGWGYTLDPVPAAHKMAEIMRSMIH